MNDNSPAARRFNRRVWIIGLVVVILAVVIRVSNRSRVTPESFDAITLKMTRSQVHDLFNVRPDHQSIYFGRVESPDSFGVNFGGPTPQLKAAGYQNYSLEQWNSPTVTIHVVCDEHDKVVCKYKSAGQRMSLLGRIWPKQTKFLGGQN